MLKASPQASSETQKIGQPANAGKMPEQVTLVIEHALETHPDDFSLQLERLLNPAMAEITLVHAMPDALHEVPINTADWQRYKQGVEARERQHDALRSRMRETLENFHYVIREDQKCHMTDECVREILDFLNVNRQDLLLIAGGNQPGSAFSRRHFSEHLATHVSCSALLLRKPFLKDREKLHVLFAVDSTDASVTAASRLAELIRPDNLEVTLVTVQSPLYIESAAVAPVINPGIIEQALQTNTKMIFEMVGGMLRGKGITVRETRTLIGSPATEIGYLAEREQPDLLVAGSHNRKGILGWLIGSVSAQLLHWLPYNILVVR